MIVDQHASQLWLAHGARWSDDMARIASGVTRMSHKRIEHLRRVALAMAALSVSTAFVGVAVLPGYLV